MDARSRHIFLALIAAQAAHSVEEYLFRLYDLLAPTRAISDLAGFGDRAAGFIIANSALVLFGLWCWLARVRPDRPSARGLAWFWALLEIANGLGHAALGAGRGRLFPGPRDRALAAGARRSAGLAPGPRPRVHRTELNAGRNGRGIPFPIR